MAEVAQAGKDAQRFGERHTEVAQPYRDFASKDRAGGGAEDADVFRLVRFQKLAVDGNCVVERGGKWVLRSEAIEYGDDLRLREEGDRDGLGEGARVGVEASTVQVDQDPSLLCLRHRERGNDADRNACNFRGLHGDGVSGLEDFAGAVLPFVGMNPAFGEGLRNGGIGDWPCKQPLGLGADGFGDRYDARNDSRSVGLDGAPSRDLCRGECCGREAEC